MRKRLLSIITLLLVSTLLFAAGAKEVASDETVVKVLSVETTDDGYFRLTVQRTDGTVVIYTAGDETVFSVPAQQIHEGSVLAIKDNGIATMSIPAQMFPTEIRDLTLAVSLGAYSFDWAEPGLGAPAVQESSLRDITLKEDLQSRFSYAYAYDLFSSYADQGVTFRGSYLARGILDFYNGTEPLIPVSSMAEDVDLYISTIFNNNVAESTGPAPSSLDEIYAITGFEDLSQRFSYAYGYLSAKGLEASSLYPHAGYFARGIIDAGNADEDEPLLASADMNAAMEEYIADYIQKGILTDHGDVYATLDSIMELGVPEDPIDKFAYAYGYVSYLNLLYSGIEVYAPEFAYGALAAFYGAVSPYTADEMNAIVEEYVAELQAEYQAWLDELAASNLEKAESFLADNAGRERVITTDSGLQVEFTFDDESESAAPAEDSLVVVDYTLTLMDGTVMDQGENVEFSLSNLIPGFSEAVMMMSVGDSVRAYVHPSLGYGETGTPTIEPNSLLIFDITLDEIR